MRLDKYLKVSRIIKRRTVAKEAGEGGRVSINGKTAKPSAEVKEGDVIEIRFGDPAKEDKPGENIILPKDPGYIKHQEADINHFRQSLIKKAVKKAGVDADKLTDADIEFLVAETKTDVDFVKKTLGL